MSSLAVGPSGGTGGIPFDDVPPGDGARVRFVRVWSSSIVEAIQLVHERDGELVEHPIRGTAMEGIGIIELVPGEHIIEVYGRYSSYVEFLTIRTDKGQIRRFGGQGGHCDFVYGGPAGHQIIGFWGRADRVLDAFGVRTAPIVNSERVQVDKTATKPFQRFR